MFSHDKIRLYLFAFLAFCVFSSKNIIIYNEETLVAISFFAFVLFVSHYYGNTIKDSLNERSQAIQIELQNFLNLKKDSLLQLREEHLKVSKLNTPLNALSHFTHRELAITTSQGDFILAALFAQLVVQKLKTLSFSKSTKQQKLQQNMASTFFGNVLFEFQQSKKENKKTPINRELLENALHILSEKKAKF